MTKKNIHQLSTVNNAISLLGLFLRYDSIGLIDIEKELDISKTAAFRLAATMADRGILYKDEKTKLYYPGPLLFQLIRKYQQKDIVTLAQPYIGELANQTNESVYLSIRTGYNYMYLIGVESTYPVKVTIPLSDEMDLYIGAAGKLHLAFMSSAEINYYFKRTKLQSFTPNSLTVEQVKEQIAQIKKDKYSTSFGERISDAGGIAAPIWDLLPEPIATLGIYFPMTRIDSERKQKLTNLVIQYAEKISILVKDNQEIPN